MKAQVQFFPYKLTNIAVNIVAFSTLLGPKWNVFFQIYIPELIQLKDLFQMVWSTKYISNLWYVRD